jgi:hypothetical protein
LAAALGPGLDRAWDAAPTSAAGAAFPEIVALASPSEADGVPHGRMLERLRAHT